MPKELELEFKVRNYGVLPEAGGLRDQRVGELDRMTTARNVYDAVRGFKEASDWLQWRRQQPHLWKIWNLVLELRDDGAE